MLRSIESKIEGLFEGVFGRAFRAHVQPVELARKLAKEMDEHRSVSVSRVYVPNEYTIYLSPSDRQQFVSYEGSLIGELQEYLSGHARREGYAMLTPPRVLITTDEDLAMGEFGIAVRVVQPDSEVSLPEPALALPVAAAVEVPAQTVVYRPVEPIIEEAPPPEVAPEKVALVLDGREHPIVTGRMVIGRSRECDLRVGDTNVSRRHAEVVQEGTSWWVVDLGSTNGTSLNGAAVSRARLDDEDRIQLGSTELTFRRSLS